MKALFEKITMPVALTLAAVLSAGAFGVAGGPASKHSVPHAPITAEDEYEVDLAHSTLNFRVRHFNVSYFYGRINKPEGAFLLNSADPAKSRVTITAEIANMDAGNENRNKFLLSPDFFNGREYPTTEFKSTSVKKIDTSTWEAAGNFTLHGVTKPVTVRLTEYAEATIPKFGHRAGFLCVFTIKRSDYGMGMYAKDGTLGDEVEITAAIEGAHE